MNEESPQSSPSPELEARIVALLLGEASDFEREELNRLFEERADIRQFKEKIQRVHQLMQHAAGDEPLEEHAAGDEPLEEDDGTVKDDWKLNAEKRATVLDMLGGETTVPSSAALFSWSPSEADANSQVITPVVNASPQYSPVSMWPKSITWPQNGVGYFVTASVAVIAVTLVYFVFQMNEMQPMTIADNMMAYESTNESEADERFKMSPGDPGELYDDFVDYEKEEADMYFAEGAMTPPAASTLMEREASDWKSSESMDRRNFDADAILSEVVPNSANMSFQPPVDLDPIEMDSERKAETADISGSEMGGISGIHSPDMKMNSARNMKRVLGSDIGGEGMDMDMKVSSMKIMGAPMEEQKETNMDQGRVHNATRAGKQSDMMMGETIASSEESRSPQNWFGFSQNAPAKPQAASKSSATVPSQGGRASGPKPTSSLVDGTITFPTVPVDEATAYSSRLRGLETRNQLDVSGSSRASKGKKGTSIATPPVFRSDNALKQAAPPSAPPSAQPSAPPSAGPYGGGLGGGGFVGGGGIGAGGGVGGMGNKAEKTRKLAEANAGGQQSGEAIAQEIEGRTATLNDRISTATPQQSPGRQTSTPTPLDFPTLNPQANFFDSGVQTSASAESSRVPTKKPAQVSNQSLDLNVSGRIESERLSKSIVDGLERDESLGRKSQRQPQASVAGPGPGVINSIVDKEMPLGLKASDKPMSEPLLQSQQNRFKDQLGKQSDPFADQSTLKADLSANGLLDFSKSSKQKSSSSQRDFGDTDDDILSLSEHSAATSEKQEATKLGILSKETATTSKIPTGLKELDATANEFSTFSLHVSDVSFKLAQSSLGKGEWPQSKQIRIEEFVNAFDYGDPMPTQNEKVACRIEQTIHPFLQQRNLLRVAMRTAAAGRASNTPLRLTFLLDNSGSMERIDRQQTVRRAFAVLAQQLKPIDQITLISFARQPRLLADRVSGGQAANLLQMIDNLPSEGGTNLEAALQLAFEKALEQRQDNAQNRVILLTDGAVNLGDASPDRLSNMIVTMRNAGIAFDAAGISADGLNDEILEALTRKGDGRYYLLDSLETVDDGFAKQIAGALRPAAKNVKIQIEFNPERVGKYMLLGFEKHRLKKEDFRNDKIDAAEMSAAEAGVAVYQIEAKPDGYGDIGTVSIRFQDMASGKMVEELWPIPYQTSTLRHDIASPSMKIATAATMLATKLKGEALSDTVDLKVLANLVAGLPQQIRNNRRVQMLQAMIQQARQFSGN